MNKLDENVLEQVAGGRGTNANTDEKAVFATKKEEFEAAWDALKMEQNGYTGNMRAELFEDWEELYYKPSAVKFLSKYSKM